MDIDDSDTPKGKVLTFPSGESINPDDLGADYIVGQGHQSSVAELVNPQEISKDFRDREEYVSRQELLVKVNEKLPAVDLVEQVIKEISEELAHLKYERRKAAKEGKNTANYTISRISSLRSLADVLMKRMENARAEQLDLKSPRFREVLKLWMEFVYESMVKVEVPEQIIDLVFKQIEADIKDWEQKIINI